MGLEPMTFSLWGWLATTTNIPQFRAGNGNRTHISSLEDLSTNHYAIPALEAPLRLELRKLLYKSSVLPLNYRAIVPLKGLEPLWINPRDFKSLVSNQFHHRGLFHWNLIQFILPVNEPLFILKSLSPYFSINHLDILKGFFSMFF